MNQNQLPLTGDSAIVADVIRKRAPDLLTRGFEFTRTTLEGSKKTVECAVFHFENKKNGLRLNISFSAAAQGLNGGFVALITKPVNRKLDVEDYLKRRGRNVDAFFSYRDPTTDVRFFAESFVDTLIGALDSELRPVVEGKTFEETPIDWGGYR